MPTYTVQEVAATIDHAVLKPNQTDDDIRSNVLLAKKWNVASLCVRPSDVKLTASLLKDSDVKTSCVLSFPHGDDTTATKVFQATQAIQDGVEEIDMVMNIGQFLSGNLDRVRDDIAAVVEVAHASDVIVKVIQESCYLTIDQVATACELAHQAGADFVKTSTGFGTSSATPEIIGQMVKTVGGKMEIKASGGIRSWDQAVAYLEQGATRLGIGATETVLQGGISTEDY